MEVSSILSDQFVIYCAVNTLRLSLSLSLSLSLALSLSNLGSQVNVLRECASQVSLSLSQ